MWWWIALVVGTAGLLAVLGQASSRGDGRAEHPPAETLAALRCPACGEPIGGSEAAAALERWDAEAAQQREAACSGNVRISVDVRWPVICPRCGERWLFDPPESSEQAILTPDFWAASERIDALAESECPGCGESIGADEARAAFCRLTQDVEAFQRTPNPSGSEPRPDMRWSVVCSCCGERWRFEKANGVLVPDPARLPS